MSYSKTENSVPFCDRKQAQLCRVSGTPTVTDFSCDTHTCSNMFNEQKRFSLLIVGTKHFSQCSEVFQSHVFYIPLHELSIMSLISGL